MSQVSVSEFGSKDDVQRSGILAMVLAVPLIIFISTFGDFKECAAAAELVAASLAILWAYNRVTDMVRDRD